MYLAQDLARTNFPSVMAQDLGRVTFHVPGQGLGQNRFFQVTWPRTWEEQTFHVLGLGLGLEQSF